MEPSDRCLRDRRQYRGACGSRRDAGTEFNINVENNFLVISGVRSEFPERRLYHQMEIRFGEFSTSIELPTGVDVAKAQAEYEDGFLSVVLPKITPTNVQIKG